MPTDDHAHGIICRVRPLTESSLIIHWLTRQWGLLATVAKGARRPKSPFRGKLDLFYQLEFTFQRSRRSDLHNLKEVRLLFWPECVRTNLDLLNAASYAVRLIEIAVERETPIPEYYESFAAFLGSLASQKSTGQIALTWELKLLKLSGLGVDLAPRSSPGAAKLIEAFEHLSWEQLKNLALTESQLREVAHLSQHAWLHHFGRIPPGRKTLMLSGGKTKSAE